MSKQWQPNSPVNRSRKTSRTTPTLGYKGYSMEQIRSGLAALIYGKSKRSAAELCGGVPPNTLGRYFVQLTGQRANVKRPLNKPQRDEALRKLSTFRPKHNSNRLFMPHEELLLVNMLEVATKSSFPCYLDVCFHGQRHINGGDQPDPLSTWM